MPITSIYDYPNSSRLPCFFGFPSTHPEGSWANHTFWLIYTYIWFHVLIHVLIHDWCVECYCVFYIICWTLKTKRKYGYYIVYDLFLQAFGSQERLDLSGTKQAEQITWDHPNRSQPESETTPKVTKCKHQRRIRLQLLFLNIVKVRN